MIGRVLDLGWQSSVQPSIFNRHDWLIEKGLWVGPTIWTAWIVSYVPFMMHVVLNKPNVLSIWPSLSGYVFEFQEDSGDVLIPKKDFNAFKWNGKYHVCEMLLNCCPEFNHIILIVDFRASLLQFNSRYWSRPQGSRVKVSVIFDIRWIDSILSSCGNFTLNKCT